MRGRLGYVGIIIAAALVASLSPLYVQAESPQSFLNARTQRLSDEPDRFAVAEGDFRMVWDDFKDGFDVGPEPDDKWFYFVAGPYVGDDGIETTSANKLTVVSSGINSTTGEPEFVRTIGQDSVNGGLPGGLDHVKWLVYMNHLSSSGVPGFDAISGQELACESWISGETFGTEGHPFGDEVVNSNDDLRLASVALNTIDLESWMVFDFFLTNERVYAFYERLPFGRDILGDYAAFSFMVPVAERSPNNLHHVKIAYDKDAGTVRWLLNDVEVFRVEQIGYLIDRQFMTIDHGGTEEIVSPSQLNCGMGMFSLLDAHLPSGIGLVRLSDASNFYFNPEEGGEEQTFVDDESLLSSRLFGQGAQLETLKYVVESRPVGE